MTSWNSAGLLFGWVCLKSRHQSQDGISRRLPTMVKTRGDACPLSMLQKHAKPSLNQIWLASWLGTTWEQPSLGHTGKDAHDQMPHRDPWHCPDLPLAGHFSALSPYPKLYPYLSILFTPQEGTHSAGTSIITMVHVEYCWIVLNNVEYCWILLNDLLYNIVEYCWMFWRSD